MEARAAEKKNVTGDKFGFSAYWGFGQPARATRRARGALRAAAVLVRNNAAPTVTLHHFAGQLAARARDAAMMIIATLLCQHEHVC